MAVFLSQEWLDLLRGRLAEVDGAATGSAPTVRVEHVVTKGPEGEVRWVAVFEAGSLVAATLGGADDVELSLTTVYDDAVAILRGTLDLNTAFMQGRMKVAGPTGPLLRLLAASQHPAYRVALGQVLEATTF